MSNESPSPQKSAPDTQSSQLLILTKVLIVCASTIGVHIALLNLWPHAESFPARHRPADDARASAFAESRQAAKFSEKEAALSGSRMLASTGSLTNHSSGGTEPRISEPAPFQPHASPLPLSQADSSPPAELPLKEPATLPDLPLDSLVQEPNSPSKAPQASSNLNAPRSPREMAARQQRLDVIKKELPSASEDELNIWVDQFQDVPVESLRDLIRLRQQFPVGLPKSSMEIGSQNFGIPGNSDQQSGKDIQVIPSQPDGTFSGEFGSHQIPAPSSGEVLRTADVIEAVAPEIRVLRAAQQIHRQNMAQAKTIGYRRRVVQLQSHGTQHADQVPTLNTTIDPTPGEWIITDRPLDLAIQGYGWFVVRHDQQQLLTRVGHLVWNEHRQLAVEIGTKSYPLDPPIVAPEGCTQLLIEETGNVQAATAGSELSSLGVIVLATIPDATQLQEKVPGLFATTGKSGNLTLHTAETARSGKLIAGRLEQSNVNSELELQFHRDLDDQISLLRTAWEESLSRLNWSRNE
ncbi:Flagellar basal-body rod protein FlgF [Planctopirus ephydatiae]|uniref:Flagellar basal-body rod protein FlgF n=1 Tax=Planctopirus ephydatiae TaxID=2528019 RepID=A0A518GLI3_9PLAN|nr:flagellar hook basal-body protein [Planctopirus ephydatiae]QDV29428.1 Flagellar basal-body rod protein FlgF [Planctopirus ephydatiae]